MTDIILVDPGTATEEIYYMWRESGVDKLNVFDPKCEKVRAEYFELLHLAEEWWRASALRYPQTEINDLRDRVNTAFVRLQKNIFWAILAD